MILFMKETAKNLDGNVAIENDNSVQEISTNDKTIHLDPSEKSTKNISQGNVTSKCHLYVKILMIHC